MSWVGIAEVADQQPGYLNAAFIIRFGVREYYSGEPDAEDEYCLFAITLLMHEEIEHILAIRESQAACLALLDTIIKDL